MRKLSVDGVLRHAYAVADGAADFLAVGQGRYRRQPIHLLATGSQPLDRIRLLESRVVFTAVLVDIITAHADLDDVEIDV